MVSRRVIALAWVAAALVTGSALAKEGGASQKEFALPAGTDVSFRSLQIAPQAGKILYHTIKWEGPPGRSRPTVASWVLDMKTGKASPLRDAIAGLPQSGTLAAEEVSPDGMNALLRVLDAGGMAAYLADLRTLQAKKLADGTFLKGCWVGNRIGLSRAIGEELDQIKLLDPATGKAEELPIRGVIMAADAKGGMLIVAANAKDPAAKVGMEALEKGMSILCMDAKGQGIRDLGPAGAVSSQPILSASGKYLAFQAKPLGAPDGPKTAYSVQVIATDGTMKWTVPGVSGQPAGVLDDGSVIATERVHDEEGTPLHLCDPKGNKKPLGKAADARVVGDKLYIATAGDKPAIKIIDLPPAK